MSCRVTGAASVDATSIDTDRLDVAVTGATTVTIAGRAVHQDITIRGASTYDAAALDSRTVTVDATGASRVVVRVSEALTARALGASTVTYIGTPSVHVDGRPGSVHRQ